MRNNPPAEVAEKLRSALTSAIFHDVSQATVLRLYQEIKEGKKSPPSSLEIPETFLPLLDDKTRTIAVYHGSGYAAGQIARAVNLNTCTVSKVIAGKIKPALGYVNASQLPGILHASGVPFAPLKFESYASANARLNDIERMILEASTGGLTNLELADFFGLSPKGMNWRMSTIFRKIGCNNRVAMVRWWIENGGAYEPFVLSPVAEKEVSDGN